jgi:hypothetical protein
MSSRYKVVRADDVIGALREFIEWDSLQSATGENRDDAGGETSEVSGGRRLGRGSVGLQKDMVPAWLRRDRLLHGEAWRYAYDEVLRSYDLEDSW